MGFYEHVDDFCSALTATTSFSSKVILESDARAGLDIFTGLQHVSVGTTCCKIFVWSSRGRKPPAFQRAYPPINLAAVGALPFLITVCRKSAVWEYTDG